MIIENFILMHIGMTENALEITREMVEASYKSFNGIPVILVDKSLKRDYMSEDTYTNDRVIGIVADDSCHIDDDAIVGTVILWDDKFPGIPTNKMKYDNWAIKLCEDSIKFTVDAIELFQEKGELK